MKTVSSPHAGVAGVLVGSLRDAGDTHMKPHGMDPLLGMVEAGRTVPLTLRLLFLVPGCQSERKYGHEVGQVT